MLLLDIRYKVSIILLFAQGLMKVIRENRAEWLKGGVEYFSGAEYRLDPYHLQKNLLEALWYDEETYDKVREAIYQGELEKTQRTLEEAIKKTKGERQKRLVGC